MLRIPRPVRCCGPAVLFVWVALALPAAAQTVAFGTMVQMVLERRPMGEVERVMRWCRELGLPVRLSELGKLDMSYLPKAAEKACDPNDSMSAMPFTVTPDMVLGAMREVDSLAQRLG